MITAKVFQGAGFIVVTRKNGDLDALMFSTWDEVIETYGNDRNSPFEWDRRVVSMCQYRMGLFLPIDLNQAARAEATDNTEAACHAAEIRSMR